MTSSREKRVRSFSLLLAVLFWTLPLFGAVSWEQHAPVPQPRSEVAAASLDGQIYLIGGFAKEGVTPRVDRYDSATDRWVERAAMPVALHHAGAAALNGKLYVIGGFEGAKSWKPSRGVWEYDPTTDRWSAKREMPTARGALGVGVWQGRVYAIGGLGATEPGRLLENTGANEVYDPAADRWETKAPLPNPRDHLAVAVLEGAVHAIGGRFNSDYATNVALHHIYDPAVDRWRQAAPLPRRRSGIAAAVVNGKIYVFGGESPQGTFSDNDVYNPTADRWQGAPPMPTARHGLGAAAVADRIYVIAGGPQPGGSLSNVNEMFRPE
ncbi:MAG: galactose oxidase [Nitrospirae bacterium]|nr:galactose oxidase [Candidatus Manganitrophaceae bacterium]